MLHIICGPILAVEFVVKIDVLGYNIRRFVECFEHRMYTRAERIRSRSRGHMSKKILKYPYSRIGILLSKKIA